MKKFFVFYSAFFAGILTPIYVYAQANPAQGFVTLGGLIRSFTDNVVKALVALLLGLATVAFFYGIVQYIWGLRQGDSGKAKVGNQFMIWGLVALFVMVSVWGIIVYVQTIFGIQGQNGIVIPGVQIGTQSGGGAPAGGGLPSGTAVGGGGGFGIGVGGGVTGGGTNGSTLSASNAYCRNAGVGAVCDLGGGLTGTCDVNTEGTPGCYRTAGGTGGTSGGGGGTPSTNLNSCLLPNGTYGTYVNGNCEGGGGGINYGVNCSTGSGAGTCSDQMSCINDIGGTPVNSSSVTATCGTGSVCCIPPTSGGSTPSPAPSPSNGSGSVGADCSTPGR